MILPINYSESQLNAAKNHAGEVVVAFMEGLILRVEELLSTATHQRSIFETSTKETSKVDVNNVTGECFLDTMDTPTTSNITTAQENTYQTRPTKRMINIPPKPTVETMTEELSNFMFELGYDSNGEPPFFGNSTE